MNSILTMDLVLSSLPIFVLTRVSSGQRLSRFVLIREQRAHQLTRYVAIWCNTLLQIHSHILNMKFTYCFQVPVVPRFVASPDPPPPHHHSRRKICSPLVVRVLLSTVEVSPRSHVRVPRLSQHNGKGRAVQVGKRRISSVVNLKKVRPTNGMT